MQKSTSATSQRVQEAERQRAFTKAATEQPSANRASWRRCGLQTHPAPKPLASSRVVFVVGQVSLPSQTAELSSWRIHPQWFLAWLEVQPPRSTLSSSTFILKNVFPLGSKDKPHKVNLNKQNRKVHVCTVVGVHPHSNKKFYLNLLEKYKKLHALEK